MFRLYNKGPEPEGVVTATLAGKVYAFIALERIGGVMVYNVTNPAAPVFVQYINSKSATTVAGDLGAEGIFFIPANQSPTGVPLVVVSNEVSGTISVYSVGGVAIPTAPTVLIANANNTLASIAFIWTDNANNETGFEIQRSATSATAGFATLATVNANIVTYTDNTINNNEKYYYRVRAINDFGYSTFSNVLDTPAIPNAPTTLQVQTAQNPTRNTLTWIDNASNEVGYSVERKTLTGTFAEIIKVTTGNTYTDNTAVIGQGYVYRVGAYNISGNSAYSNEVTIAVTNIETDIFEQAVKVFPNPAQDAINLQIDLQKGGDLIIRNAVGEIMRIVALPNENIANLYRINLTNLPKGLYIFEIKVGKAQVLRKLIVK